MNFANLINGTTGTLEDKLGLSQQTKNILINKQIPIFRGYGRDGNIELGNNKNLEIEDPSYIIFDINIDANGSPLFNQVEPFLKKYAKYDREIEDVYLIYTEFITKLKLLFPVFQDASTNNKSGGKRHYINSITGLDVLNKPIINYPEDKLTFKLSEDITMLVQYISELYSNLTYSFASNRQLVPSNLLLFNMYIILSDVRDMKRGLTKVGVNYADKVSEDKSKFIYVLHDCEFNFFSSKLHTDEVTVGGYSSGPTTTPASLNLSMNFKSYSRILSPALMEGAYLLDYRLKKFGFGVNNGSGYKQPIVINGKKIVRDKDGFDTVVSGVDSKGVNNYETFYNYFNNDYKTENEFLTDNKKRYNVAGIDPVESNFDPNSTLKQKTDYFGKLSDKAKNTITTLGSSLTNKLNTETQTLSDTLQKGAANLIGINMTVDKINVYYETPQEKTERLSLLTMNLADKLSNSINKTVGNGLKDIGDEIGFNGNRDNNFSRLKGSFNGNIIKDTLNDISGLVTGKGIKSEIGNGNVYPRDIDIDYMRSGNISNNDKIDNNDKKPLRDQNNIINDVYNTNLYEDDNSKIYNYIDENGNKSTIFDHYNKKYPDGSLEDNSTYNQKFPIGNLEEKGTYNQKYPDGDLEEKGTYNQKFPIGNLEDSATYNQKFPVGDLEEKGTYNQKYPVGDLENSATYNEKHPDGTVSEKGTYNEKYPNGDLEDSATYNEKHPDGTVSEKGTYNEKYPDGIVEEKGKYNQKFPQGSLQNTSTYNEKYPDGIVEEKGKYNQKFPQGDVEDSSIYNQKFPDGKVSDNGNYNQKFPQGDVEEKGKYNEKYPDGTIEEKGKYNQKFPKGDIEEKGIYNEKFPNNGSKDNIYDIDINNIDENGQYRMKFPENENVYLKK